MSSGSNSKLSPLAYLYISVGVALVGWLAYSATSNPSVGSARSGPSTVPVESAAVTAVRDMQEAPDFELKDTQGKTHKLSDYRGKVVLLNFWATWCKPCKVELPDVIGLQDDYGVNGLQVLGISVDDNGAEVLPPFIVKWKINYPILLGTREVGESYGGIAGIPTTFLIDKKGKIVTNFVGARTRQDFESQIKKLL
jgi:peroxiredoxin